MIIVGEALVDLVPEEDGRLDPRSGGSARNVAIAAARLGADTTYVGGLSRDQFGRRLRQELVTEGVDTSSAPEVDAPTPLAVVTLGPDGQAQYDFHLAGTAALALHGDDLAALPDDQALHVSLGAVTLATPVIGDALVALLGSHTSLTSLDPNVRAAASTGHGVDAERIDAAASLVDLVRCSEEDLALLHPDRDPAEVAAAWLDAGTGAVVVTRGADGAVAWTSAGAVRSGVPTIAGDDSERGTEEGGTEEGGAAAGDTVGAGDTFGAGLLVALTERGITTRADLLALTVPDWEAVLAFAGRAAAITVQRRGADPPSRAEL